MSNDLVLTESGLRALLDRLEAQSVRLRQDRETIAQLSRKVDTLERDNRHLERNKADRLKGYHKSLEAHRALLKKQGLKVKTLPDLPPEWETIAAEIKRDDDIPF